MATRGVPTTTTTAAEVKVQVTASAQPTSRPATTTHKPVASKTTAPTTTEPVVSSTVPNPVRHTVPPGVTRESLPSEGKGEIAMKRVVAVLALGLTLLLAGCGTGNETRAVASTGGATSGQPATMPAGEPAKPHATPLIPSTEADNPASEAARAAEKVASAAKKVNVTFVMPNLVAKNLQKAQDDLQSLGSYLLDEQDATGKGRITLLDSDWKVCGQKPAAGGKVLIVATVQLAAVKLNESCPK